jgi:hypothetical protein
VLARAYGELPRYLLRGSGGLAHHTRQNTIAAQRPL